MSTVPLTPAIILNNDELNKLPKIPRTPLLPEIPGKSIQEIKNLEKDKITQWMDILKNYNSYLKKNPIKLKEFIRQGVPDSIRGMAWLKFTDSEEISSQCKEELDSLLSIHQSEIPDQHTKKGGSVDLQASRTFPSVDMFKSESSWGTQRLRRLLIGYCVKHPEIGYCQGMNYVGAMLLMYLQENQAFWLFNNIIHENKYDLKLMYGEGLYKLHMCSYIFDCLLKKFIPKIKEHFEAIGLQSIIYLSEWLIPLFARSFPLEFVVRVWDAFLFEGNKILFRVSLALIKFHVDQLLKADLAGCMDIIQNMHNTIVIDRILKISYDWSLSHTHIEKFQAQYQTLNPVVDLSSPNLQPEESVGDIRIPSPVGLRSSDIDETCVDRTPIKSFEQIENMTKRPRDILLLQIPDKSPEEIQVIEEDRINRWIEILTNYQSYTSNRLYRFRLKKVIRTSIPDSLRGKAWLILNGAEGEGKRKLGSLDSILKKYDTTPTTTHTKIGGTIDRDIHRTFSELEMFGDPEQWGCQRLKRILIGYCLIHPEIGYCQGMNFIAGILVQYLPENQAFWLFHSVVHDKKYDLQKMYGEGLSKLHLCVYQFDCLMKKFNPKVKDHFEQNGIMSAMYISEWFIPLFARTFPLRFVVRVWDAFLYEGIKILFRIALSIIQVYESEFLNATMEGILKIFRELPDKVDVEEILKVAYSLSLSHRHLEKFESEYFNLSDSNSDDQDQDQNNSVSVDSPSGDIQIETTIETETNPDMENVSNIVISTQEIRQKQTDMPKDVTDEAIQAGKNDDVLAGGKIGIDEDLFNFGDNKSVINGVSVDRKT